MPVGKSFLKLNSPLINPHKQDEISVITTTYAREIISLIKSFYSTVRNLSWKGIIFFLFGAFLLFLFTQEWLMGFASVNWQTTQGKIISSKAVVCRSKYSLVDNYVADIIYEYSVSNVLYSSRNITYSMDSPIVYCGNAEKMMKQYPVGMSVLVYYEPENPKNSVLRPGGTNFAGIGISLAILIYGINLFGSESIFSRTKITKRNLKNRVQVKQ